MESPQIHTDKTTQAESIQIDLRRWFFHFLSYWWLFLLSFAIAIPCGHAYLRYTTYQYSARALLLIKDAGRSGDISEESILLAEGFTGGRKAMDNEIQILRSLPLIEKVIDTLNANITYHRMGKIKERELYNASPIKVDTFSLPLNRTSVTFYLQANDQKTFRLKANEEEEGSIFEYGVPFLSKFGYFSISYVPGQNWSNDLFRISIRPVVSVARQYQSKLRIERVGDQRASSVLDLRMNDPVPQKAEDILNTLIHIYNEEEIKDENKVLRNTIRFIDDRIKKLTHELDSVESNIERFKMNNAIITEDAVSSMNFNLAEIRSAAKELSIYEVQKSLLSSLEDFLLANRETFDYIPSNLISENPVLSSLVSQYNSLLIELDQLAKVASPQNPSRLTLEKRLTDLRELIISNLQKVKKDLTIPVERIKQEIVKLESNMSTVPGMEKNLLAKKRTQSIKENLFLLLLQKREETALSAAVTTASTRVIDHARSSTGPVTPKRKLILMAASLIGLIIPILLILLRKMMETTIQSEETVKSLTNIPILGRITHHKKDEKIVVKTGDRSAINEMFRLLRTNLNYLNPDSDKQVLLITSSVSGEGKSFIAINLAIALSLSNKKVVLLGLDLRKPKMASYLGVDHKTAGISNYLIGKSTINDIVHQFQDNPNFSYISSGPIPPNPAELILSDRMKQLIDELQEDYDYILIDSPPIGLVSDALQLRDYVSNILIVVRHQLTRKVMLKNLEEMYKNKDLENSVIILNDIKRNRSSYGYGYGYGYGGYHYGYGQGYYKEE